VMEGATMTRGAC